ncbi:MAG: (2E,6E)-farnesyl diphosphate synthase [Gammaproteobacteria bacterium]|nr:(2E,6E)-farnesyl diphosphate synthase [Gammaproteobacteria bacterium]
MPPATSFEECLKRYRDRVHAALEARLPPASDEPRQLHEAMRYAVLNGGKRVRAVLVYAAGEAVGTAPETLDAPACAVELIHAYSLVHDDLPVMDNDDLRRGQPTCHRAFDEATALLAGDALQSLAFEVLLDDGGPAGAARRAAMAWTLAGASGSLGMAGGQAIDLAAVGKSLTLEQLENMHRHKTGALIRASVRMGALSGDGSSEQTLDLLDRYACCIGLAFQIRDDILDVEGDTAVLGKQSGADSALNKPTYPALLGLEEAKQKARELHEQALACLQDFGAEADPLRWLSEFIVNRPH